MVLLSLSVAHAADHSDGSITQGTPVASPMRGAENHPIKDPGVARKAAKKKSDKDKDSTTGEGFRRYLESNQDQPLE